MLRPKHQTCSASQELANEEAMLSQQMSADQGRWTDVNNQLDQLERSLTPPKQ